MKCFGNTPSIYFNLLEGTRDFIASKCFSVYFSKALPKGEYRNLACFVICPWLEGNISSPVRLSYLSFFPDYSADIFAASLLISCCNFSSLILTLIVMIIFYIRSKILFLKCKGLSDAKVASITKKEYGFAVHFLHFTKSWKSICDEWLNYNLLKFLFAWSVHNKIVRRI